MGAMVTSARDQERSRRRIRHTRRMGQPKTSFGGEMENIFHTSVGNRDPLFRRAQSKKKRYNKRKSTLRYSSSGETEEGEIKQNRKGTD